MQSVKIILPHQAIEVEERPGGFLKTSFLEKTSWPPEVGLGKYIDAQTVMMKCNLPRMERVTC